VETTQSKFSRWHMRTRGIAHSAPPLYAATATLNALLGLPADAHDWITVPIRHLLLLAAVAIVVCLTLHTDSCGVCAARRPADGAAQAMRHGGQLAAAHHPRKTVIVTSMVVYGLLLTIGDGWLTAQGLRAWSNLALDLAIAVAMHIAITHSLLRPWCPRCQNHRRDGATTARP
jgi:hypothetical protein